ncbi:MAG: autotransporter domain-containing protein, partial [Akkermansia sp.]
APPPPPPPRRTGSAQALTINTALTLGGSLGIDVGTTLDTINYTGTTALTGALTLDVNLIGAANQAYNFLTSTTGLVDEATLTLNMLNRGATATTSFSADKKTIIITVTNSGSIGNLTWGGTASSNVWETKGSAPWAGGTEGDNKFYMGDNVTFGSTGTKAISIAGQVTPGTIDITGNDYVFSGSGSIAGSGAMHINIGGEETNKTVTFNTNNAGYSGAITLTSGNLVLGSAGAAGTGGILFDGGTVYIGANNAIGANTITASAGKIVTLGVADSGSYTLATTNFSGLSVSKIDTGTLTLGTAMTSGTLKVMGGELITNIVDASGSVNYTIGANAKLTIHGRINSSTAAVRSGSVIIAGGTLNLADNIGENYFGGSGVTFQDQAGHIIGSNANSAQWRLEGGDDTRGAAFKFTVTAAASGSTISGPRMTFTRGDNPIVFNIANGAQEFDLSVSSKMDRQGNNETLKKEGAGTLLLTGDASSIKLDITAGTVQIGDATHGTTTGTWTGAISIGTGTNLNIDKTTTSSMGLLTGSGTLNIMNKGDVSLSTTDVEHPFSGTINLKGGGILNLNNNILGAGGKIVINQGGLSNASHYAGTISIDQTVAGAIAQTISLGGLAGNKITSFQGTSITTGADQVTKLTDIGDGNISLKPNAEGKLFLGISSDMIGTTTTGTGAIFTFTTPGTNQVIIADNTVLTLSLTDHSSSTLMNNIGKNQLIHLTNGTLTLGTGSSIAFDSPYNAFNEFFTLNGTEGGSIKVDAIDQNIPGQPNPTHGWIIVSQNSHGLTVNSTNFASVQKAIGVYNDNTITLDTTAGNITLNNLEGASNTAMINTAAGTTLTLMSTDKVANHQHIYNGGISGNAHIVKFGGDDTYKLTIGGNVSGASLTINDGNLTLNGKTNAIQGDLTLSQTGSLTLGAGSTLTSGGTLITTQDNATITLGQGSNLTLNSLANLTADIIGSGTLAINTGTIALGLTGSLDNELTLKLGQSASIHFDQNKTLAAIAGNGTITIDQTLTLGNSTGTFSGTLLGNGSISHTGTGAQTLDTLGNADMSITQQGTGTTILQNTGNQGQPITYKDIQVLEGTLQIANNTTVSDINIAKGAQVILGRDKYAEGVYQHSAILTSTNSTLTGGGSITLGGITAANANTPLFNAGAITKTGDGAFTFNAGTTGNWTELEYTIDLMAGTNIKADDYEANLLGALKNLGYKIDSITTNVDGILQIKVSSSGKNGFLNYANSANTTVAANGLWQARFDNPDVNGTLTSIINAIRDAGSGAVGTTLTDTQATQALASYAGSSVTSLLASQRDDLRQQVKWIRNRTTQMGVKQSVVNEDMPYFNAWIQGNGGYNSIDQKGDQAGYTLDTWGGTLGFDVDLNDKLTIGAAFTANYNKLKTQSFDQAEGDNDAYYANIFARVQLKKWAHTLIVTGGWNDANLNRNVAIGNTAYKAHGTTTGATYGAFYEATYDIALNEKQTSILQPLFNTSIYRSSMDDYTETGMGDASMKVSDMEATYGTVGLGARLMGIVGTNLFGRGSLGEVRAQVVQDYGDKTNEARLCPMGSPLGVMNIKGAKVG